MVLKDPGSCKTTRGFSRRRSSGGGGRGDGHVKGGGIFLRDTTDCVEDMAWGGCFYTFQSVRTVSRETNQLSAKGHGPWLHKVTHKVTKKVTCKVDLKEPFGRLKQV